MSALRELLCVFGIEVDPEKNLERGHKQVEGFQKKLEEVAKTIAEVFAVKEVYEFVESQIEAAAHVQDLADRLGVAATVVDNFGFVAKGAGIDVDGAARSLGLLEKNLGEAATKGGASAEKFSKLHIAIKDTHGAALPLTDVLGNAAEAIAKMPDANQRASAAMELFGREGKALVPILAKGREGVAALMEEAGELGNGLGDDYFENAKKAREETEKLGRVIQSLKERALAILLPAVMWLVDGLKDAAKWSLEHAKTTRVLEYAVGGLAAVIALALVDALVTAAVAAWALVAPFIPIALAIGALVWVAQDLYKAMTGADSAIGDLIESLGGVGAKAHFVTELNALWGDTKEVIDDAAYALGFFLGVWGVTLGKLSKSAVGQTWAMSMREELGQLTEALLGVGAAALAFLKTLEAIPKALKALSWSPILKAIDKTLDPVLGGADYNEKGQHYGSDVTEHGVPQSYVDEWNKHPHGPPPATFAQAGGLLRDPAAGDQTFAQAGGLARPAAVAGGAGNAGGGHVVHLTNKVTQNFHGIAKPKDAGDAASAGVSTATQKDTRNALASVVSK